MVTAKVLKTEFSYPVFSVFVNFTDDAGVLTQPQVQQIAFSGDELTNFDINALQAKIKDYIQLYETSLLKVDSVKTEINKVFDINGEVK